MRQPRERRLMIKFGFQGRREEKVLGKYWFWRREKRRRWCLVFFSELGFGEKGRDIERKDSELALWKNLTTVREGIEFAFYDCGKIFGLLIYIYIYI